MSQRKKARVFSREFKVRNQNWRCDPFVVFLTVEL